MSNEEFVQGEIVGQEKTYKPVGPTVIIELLEKESTDIHPRDVRNLPTISSGKIISIGDGVSEDKQYKCPAEIGDVVIFTQHSGDKIDDSLRIIGFRHILAICG